MKIYPKRNRRTPYAVAEERNPWEVGIEASEDGKGYSVWCETFPCKDGRNGVLGEIALVQSSIEFSGPVGDKPHYIIWEDEEVVDIAHSEKRAIEKVKEHAESIEAKIKDELRANFVPSMHIVYREILALAASENGLFKGETLLIDGKLHSARSIESKLYWIGYESGLVKVVGKQITAADEAKEAFDIPEPTARYFSESAAVNLRATKDGKFLVSYWKDGKIKTQRFWAEPEKPEKDILGKSMVVYSDNNDELDMMTDKIKKGIVKMECPLTDGETKLAKEATYRKALHAASSAASTMGLLLYDRTENGMGLLDVGYGHNWTTFGSEKVEERLKQIRDTLYKAREEEYRQAVPELR